MKIYPVFLLSMLALSLSVCNGQQQMQDVLYLKNGSIIRGAILELIPDKTVKIQTADSSIFVFTMAEVEKIAKEQTPGVVAPGTTSTAQNEPATQAGSGRSGSGLALYAGISLPTGDLAAATGSKSGAAKTGFAVGADGSLALGSVVAWMSSVNYSVNSINLGPALQGSGLSGEADSWKLLWILTGLKVFGIVSPQVEVYGFGEIGLIHGTIPQITLSAGGERATQSSASASAFGYALGAGLTLGRLSLAIRYVSGEPDYNITATSSGGTATGTYKQASSCVLVTGGIAF